MARRIRVRLRPKDQTAIETGDQVRVRALVRAPSAPAYPGGWDFSRDAFFAGVAGSGFAIGQAERVASGPPKGLARRIQWLRDTIEARVAAAVPGASGAVAAAFLTGLTSEIPREDQLAFQGSGLAHLLSVSGLHVSIVLGVTMALVRGGLALSEHAALHWPCRPIAAVTALGVAGFYTVLTGVQVPMVRSFAMACLFTLALLVGRRAVSMRALALSAVVIILAQPQEIMGASLQMSFSAVLALIAGYEALRPHLRRLQGEGKGRWVLHYLAGLALTSALAGTASTPFAAYHFGRLQIYYVLSNMVAVPLSGLLIPAGMVSLLLMPFGLEKLALVPMGWGMDVILWIARTTAALPSATLQVPHAPAWGLVVLSLGLVWVGIWRSRLRIAGLGLIVAGLVSPLLARPPDILVSEDARLIAFRTEQGAFLQSLPGAQKFTREQWGQFWAEAEWHGLPASGQAAGGAVDCTPRDCLLRTRPDGPAALLVRDRGGEVRCEEAAVLVSAEPVKAACRGSPAALVDRFTVWRQGAQAIWLEPDGPVIVSDRAERGERPWVPPPPVPRARQVAPVPPPAEPAQED